MRIHSFSRVLATILGIPFVACLYFTVEERSIGFSIALIILAAALVGIYVMYGQIDYWWKKKFPIPLDPEIQSWIDNYDVFYNALLTEDDKALYRERLSLYTDAREFISVGSEQHTVPNDIQAVIASQAVKLVFRHKDFLIGDYDRIVLYKHPFPSPQKQFLHTMEVEDEDGVLIFSMEHAIPGIVSSNVHYNIVMHAYADAFAKVNRKIVWPENDGFDWVAIEQITGFTEDLINKTIGYEQKDYVPIMITTYFTHRDLFRKVLPEIVQRLDEIFQSKISW